MRTFLLATLLAFTTENHAAAIAPDNLFSASEAWKQVLEKGDFASIDTSYLVLEELPDDAGNLSAERCLDKAPQLEKALRDNPVSLALQAAASECATALADESAAERHAQNFAALAREAMGERAENFGEVPIRVMAEADILAFIQASGEVPIYFYYALVNNGTGLKMHVALEDAERNSERWVSFDFVGAQISLQHKAGYAKYPIFRLQIARNTLNSYAEVEGSVAAELKATYVALENPNGEQRDAALASLARQGNFAATNFYVFACLMRRQAACEPTSIDLLLPWAEARSAKAMVMLAVLQADPATGRRDEKSASALLDAADRRLGGARASAQFAALLAARNEGSKPGRFANKRLQMAVGEGDPNAAWLLADIQAQKQGDGPLGDKAMANLSRAAGAGLSGAQYALGKQLWITGKKDEGRKWIASAAEQGDPGSQLWLARAFESDVDMPVDLGKASYWRTMAANNGDVDSMMWLAQFNDLSPPTAESRHQRIGWLRSATVFGNIDAAVQLADQFRLGGEGVDAGAKEAEVIYRAVLAKYDRADARRGLAALLIAGDGIGKDVDEARDLLVVDAEKGDTDSQFALGTHLLRGNFGPVDASAREWLGRAADAGNAKAGNELGIVLYYNKDGLGRDVRAGFARIEAAAESNHVQARNNLAWMLCTSDVAEFRDGQRGLGVAKWLNEETGHDVPAWIDTLAACHAATGDFEEAARLEQRIVDLLIERQPDNLDIPYFKERAQLYRDAKPFIETVGTK